MRLMHSSWAVPAFYTTKDGFTSADENLQKYLRTLDTPTSESHALALVREQFAGTVGDKEPEAVAGEDPTAVTPEQTKAAQDAPAEQHGQPVDAHHDSE